MSKLPKVDKRPKYNHNDAFRWVDSQWEKFMTEQKELKARIQELEKEIWIYQNQNSKIILYRCPQSKQKFTM